MTRGDVHGRAGSGKVLRCELGETPGRAGQPAAAARRPPDNHAGHHVPEDHPGRREHDRRSAGQCVGALSALRHRRTVGGQLLPLHAEHQIPLRLRRPDLGHREVEPARRADPGHFGNHAGAVRASRASRSPAAASAAGAQEETDFTDQVSEEIRLASNGDGPIPVARRLASSAASTPIPRRCRITRVWRTSSARRI